MSLREYEAIGGYLAARAALRSMAPAAITKTVKDACLLGRGGAGFPTGAKWSLVPMGDAAPKTKFFIANADEMEPGTFKDRLLLEASPHQLLEGMIIGAFAVQAHDGIIFLRWAYRRAARALEAAISEARDAGYLGDSTFGTGFSLKIKLHVSAGRYMCGEETGLLNALEGRRAIPRTKPPHPPVAGLFGKPTVVQNVETLCNVPHIVRHGAEWYRALSLTQEGGTKIYGVSGRVKRPGAWELPMGTTIKEILFEHAGGPQAGRRIRAVIPGGASTEFLTKESFGTPMDFASVKRAGSRLGTGTMIALDDGTCPVGMVLNLQRFFAHESCGFCTPCREGLPWIAKTLAAIESGDGKAGDLEMLSELAHRLRPGHTFCALAPGAMEPLTSALGHFRKDFERHITLGRCPWRVG